MEIKKTYYSIREVSERFGLPYGTLRFWEKEIPELSPRKNAGKTRFYSEDDLALIEQIRYLREVQHVPVSEISTHLKAQRHKLEPQMRTVQILETLREQLVALRDLI